eukprot:365864-Chlamydomonas_euryale.AAC.5
MRALHGPSPAVLPFFASSSSTRTRALHGHSPTAAAIRRFIMHPTGRAAWEIALARCATPSPLSMRRTGRASWEIAPDARLGACWGAMLWLTSCTAHGSSKR